MKLTLVAMVVVSAQVICSPLAEASLCVPPTVQKESSYRYVSSLTDALSYAKSALDRNAKPTEPDRTGLVEFLVGLKLAKIDYECAASQVSGYVESSNRAIKTSAEGSSHAFKTLAALTERSAEDFRAAMDSLGEGKSLKQGTMADRQADLAVAYDQVWKFLVTAVVAGTYAVVEENPKTGMMSELALTRAERDEVLRKLRATFGGEVTKGMQAGQMPLIAAGAVLYQVVGDPGRQPRP